MSVEHFLLVDFGGGCYLLVVTRGKQSQLLVRLTWTGLSDWTGVWQLEIKYWRKQLGEETKANIKLKERLEKRVEDAKGATKKSKKKAKKEIASYPLKVEEEILCSICAFPIPSYTPDYFCGEQMNPACHSCKSMDDFNDPF